MKKSLIFTFLILFVPNSFGDQIIKKYPDPLDWNFRGDDQVKTTSGEKMKIAGDPFILYDNGRFRMWFTAVDYEEETMGTRKVIGTAYAESEDGIVWSEQWFKDSDDGKVKLIFKPTKRGFDHWGIEDVSVVKKPGGYYMYYTANSPPNGKVYTIGLAESPDGIEWKRVGIKPVMESRQDVDWEKPFKIDGQWQGGIRSPSVVYDAKEKVYKMWYEAIGLREGKIEHTIGYAASQDGIEWERKAKPVMSASAVGVFADGQPHVIQHPNGGFQMYYTVWPRKGIKNVAERKLGSSIKYAFSEDGLKWDISPLNTGMTNYEGILGLGSANGPSALFYDNKIYLWFLDNRSLTDNLSPIRFATADLNIVDQP